MADTTHSRWSGILKQVTADPGLRLEAGPILDQARTVLAIAVGPANVWLADPRQVAAPPETASWFQARVEAPVSLALRVAPDFAPQAERVLIEVFVSVVATAIERAEAPSAVRAPLRSPHLLPLRSGSGMVLVVDDEHEVRATARGMLEALGYSAIEAEDGPSALLLFDRHRTELRAVLLDMTMPLMSGEEVFRELRLRDPGVRVVLSTGYAQVDARRLGGLIGLRGFLQKPYSVRQLSETLSRALEDQGPDIR